MKKLIFGCTLILSGVIGSVGWIISATNGEQVYWYQSIADLRGTDYLFVSFFVVMMIAGFVISIKEIQK